MTDWWALHLWGPWGVRGPSVFNSHSWVLGYREDTFFTFFPPATYEEDSEGMLRGWLVMWWGADSRRWSTSVAHSGSPGAGAAWGPPGTWRAAVYRGGPYTHCRAAGWSRRSYTGAARCSGKRTTSTAPGTWPRPWWCCPRCTRTSSTAAE